ncbi:helix-turn-helix transcriptional regulator [Amycolatopsis xylanica]|uniref:helix-turn-helix transcriptional regulator n=1 Tax=Amycolatopsis xylanica TaxID=589385 RepID=UPI001C40AD8E|nr:response regulator transcription factor [Amycolatopsis xylanica]
MLIAVRDERRLGALARMVGSEPDCAAPRVVVTVADLVAADRTGWPDVIFLDVGLTDSPPPLSCAAVAVTDDRFQADSLPGLAEVGIRGVVRAVDRRRDMVAAMRTVLDGGCWLAPALGGDLLASLAGNTFCVPGNLTAREVDVLNLVSAGLSNAEIAERLFITGNTAKYHIRNLLTKFAARDRAHLVAISCRITRNYPNGWGRLIAK